MDEHVCERACSPFKLRPRPSPEGVSRRALLALTLIMGLSFMRWELDAHACVRVYAYVDIPIALFPTAGLLLRFRMCSFFYEMGNGCACVHARALHEHLSRHSCTSMHKAGVTARASATIRLTPELVQ